MSIYDCILIFYKSYFWSNQDNLLNDVVLVQVLVLVWVFFLLVLLVYLL